MADHVLVRSGMPIAQIWTEGRADGDFTIISKMTLADLRKREQISAIAPERSSEGFLRPMAAWQRNQAPALDR
jgi:hypothetical protein